MKYQRFVVWGFKNFYHTHSHIHEAFFRALKALGKDVHWFDHGDHLPNYDWSNTLFITNHDVALQLPVREDCFYLVHGGSDNAECKARLGHLKTYMSWNVFIDWTYAYDDSQPFGRRPLNRPNPVWCGEDAPYYPEQHHMDFRWATDLVPSEIETNKKNVRALTDSRVINYVGTYWHVNENEIGAFGRACRDGGIELRHVGAGQEGVAFQYRGHQKVVSIEENVRLVRESYFAPAIVGSHHLTEGYAPCRIFKNISYGHFGVTNSERVQALFQGRLIHNNDPYQLFFEARERLASVTTEEIHSLMDYVAQKHTYLNRLEAIFKAVQIQEES